MSFIFYIYGFRAIDHVKMFYLTIKILPILTTILHFDMTMPNANSESVTMLTAIMKNKITCTRWWWCKNVENAFSVNVEIPYTSMNT